MRVDYAFLCNGARRSDRELHAQAIGLDTVIWGEVPARPDGLQFTARLRVGEFEEHPPGASLRIEAGDGQLVGRSDVDLDFPLRTHANDRLQLVIVDLDQVQFPFLGSYTVRLMSRGNELARLVLHTLPREVWDEP